MEFPPTAPPSPTAKFPYKTEFFPTAPPSPTAKFLNEDDNNSEIKQDLQHIPVSDINGERMVISLNILYICNFFFVFF